MLVRGAVLLVLGLWLSNPSPAAEPKSADASSAAAALRAADQEWLRVFAAKDLERSVAMCLESGSVLAPNAPRATGQQAIRALFAGFFAIPDLTLAWHPSDARAAKSGDLGYTTGDYQMSFKDPSGKTVSDRGKYVTVWEKQRDGSWRVQLDIFNSDVPVEPPSQ